MNCYDDGFYHEPSEFEMLVDDFKESLLKSVKEEFVSEMKRLREENATLQSVKKNFEEIKRDYENTKRELDREYSDLKRKVRSERLVELMEDYKLNLYDVNSRREIPPKCDKCDRFRQVEFLTPLGRKTKEKCLCADGKIIYEPRELVRYEFKISRDRKTLIAWYRQYGDDEDGFVMDSSILAETIYSDEMAFGSLNRYSTYFKTKEDCQRYCDYLNEQEGAE